LNATRNIYADEEILMYEPNQQFDNLYNFANRRFLTYQQKYDEGPPGPNPPNIKYHRPNPVPMPNPPNDPIMDHVTRAHTGQGRDMRRMPYFTKSRWVGLDV
jgi:hypothetical protein